MTRLREPLGIQENDQLALERLHLAEADRHIAEATRRTSEQEQRVTKLAEGGHDTTAAIELLQVLADGLQAMEGHRAAIVDEIECLLSEDFDRKTGQ